MSRLAVRWPDIASLVQLLEPLQALAVAVLDEDGRLLEANRGFRRLVAADDGEIAFDAASCLALPTFATLADTRPSGGESCVYRGRITINRPTGHAATLVGEIRRRDGLYLLVAEHEIEQLEAMTTSLFDLNLQMAESQRELVRAKKQLEARERELSEMAITDSLTGLANRREFDRRLDEEIARSRRTSAPLSAMMIDLDRFKDFNDTYGHVRGDACLEAVASVLAEHTRPFDVVARYGGEEFAIILPGTTEAVARDRAEDMRQAIARVDITDSNARITASFGVAQFRDGPPEDLLAAADEALYVAKRAGRNRVCAEGDPTHGYGDVSDSGRTR